MSDITITKEEAKLIMINLRIAQLSLKNSVELMAKDDRCLDKFKEILQDSILLADILEERLDGE